MIDLPPLHDEGIVTLQIPGLYAAAFSGDGQRLLAIRKSEACFFDAMTGTLINRFSLIVYRDLCRDTDKDHLHIYAMTLNRDGSQALLGFSSGDAFRVETAGGTLLQSYPLPVTVKVTPPEPVSPFNPWIVHALTFSPDDTHIAIAYTNRYIKVWRTTDDSPVASLPSPASLFSPERFFQQTCSLAFSPDNRYLFFAGRDRVAGIWDLLSRELVMEGANHADEIQAVDELCGVIRWATATGKVWEATESSDPHCLLDVKEHWHAAFFTTDGQHVLDSEYGLNPSIAYRLPASPIQKPLSTNQDGSSLANIVKVLACHLPSDVRILLPHTSPSSVISGCITSASKEEEGLRIMLGYIDPGQRLIAIVDNDAMRISLLEVESGAILHVFPVEHRCYGVAFSDDSAVLIVQEFDRTVFPETYYYAQWDILTGTRLDSIRDDSFTRLILTTALHWQLVSLEKWSDFARLRTQLLSDGKLIVAAVKGTELWQYPSHLLHTFPRSYVWFIPSDERFILLARPENTVERWSLETGELLHTYRVDTPHPQRLAFPSDEFYFTRNNLWHGPGGYYLTGEAEGSHSTPKLDLAVDQRYAAIPYDPTHTHPYAAKEAILFDIQEDPPRPVASVAYGGELLAQRFTPEHVLQLNTAGEIYRSRLPGVPQPE